jgi:cardiolipin synthase
MKQVLRKIFSPTLLILLILLLEVSLIIFIEYFIDASRDFAGPLGEFISTYGVWFDLGWLLLRPALDVFAVITFFKVLNRKGMAPEFKIPWLVFVFLLPITTTFFYWTMSHPHLRRKDRRILEESESNFRRNFKLNYDEKEDFENIDSEYKSALTYLKNVTSLKPTAGNKVKYYKSGEYFFPDLVENLKEAKEFIFIEFFIITEGKWWKQVLDVLKQKAKEGVEVRIVYDDLGCYGTLPASLPIQLAKYGIKAKKFHPFRPALTSYLNNRDHRKIVVIDHKYAFTGGNNLADEYANDLKRFGYWKDTMVRIQGPAVANLIAIFLQNYDLTTFKPSDYDKYLIHEYEKFDEPGYLFPFGDRPGAYDYEMIGEHNYLNIINAAKKSLYISTPYLIPTNTMMDSLRNAALRGVDVHLILPAIPDKKIVYWMAKCQFHTLLRAGVNIYTYTPGFNHEKQMLADDRIAFIGTINFDYRSLVHHFECGVTLVDSPILKEMKEDFVEMIDQSNPVSHNFQMTRFQRFLCSILQLFSTMF